MRQMAAGIVLGAIRFYQRRVSPHFGPKCRFTPTCSVYAVEAVERFGLRIGGRVAINRLVRCHPFSEPRHDPLPEVVPGAPGPGRSQ